MRIRRAATWSARMARKRRRNLQRDAAAKVRDGRWMDDPRRLELHPWGLGFPATRGQPRRAAKPAMVLLQSLKLVLAEFDLQRRQVLYQVREREGARDGQHRRGTLQEPSQRDLGPGRAASLGDLGKRGAPVAVEREVGNEHDALAGAVVDDVLGRALGEVVVVLHRGDRDDPTGPLDLLDPDLGEADMPDLPGVHVLLDGAEAVLQRRLRVDAMHVVERKCSLSDRHADGYGELGHGPERTLRAPFVRVGDFTCGLARERR